MDFIFFVTGSANKRVFIYNPENIQHSLVAYFGNVPQYPKLSNRDCALLSEKAVTDQEQTISFDGFQPTYPDRIDFQNVWLSDACISIMQEDMQNRLDNRDNSGLEFTFPPTYLNH